MMDTPNNALPVTLQLQRNQQEHLRLLVVVQGCSSFHSEQKYSLEVVVHF